MSNIQAVFSESQQLPLSGNFFIMWNNLTCDEQVEVQHLSKEAFARMQYYTIVGEGMHQRRQVMKRNSNGSFVPA